MTAFETARTINRTSHLERLESTDGFGRTPRNDPGPQSFNLWLTTISPESADPRAGEVVRVAAKVTEGAVLIDLNEVRRIDSSGLALFTEAMRRITARGGNPVLIRINREVRHVFQSAIGQ